MKWNSALIIVLCVLALTAARGYAQQADPPWDFNFRAEGNAAYITGYKGNSLTPRIPSTIQGKKVTRIDQQAFAENQLTGVTIGANVALNGDSFDNGFDDFYYNNGWRAGTYTYRNDEWRRQ
jgi:hypothetical protein